MRLGLTNISTVFLPTRFSVFARFNLAWLMTKKRVKLSALAIVVGMSLALKAFRPTTRPWFNIRTSLLRKYAALRKMKKMASAFSTIRLTAIFIPPARNPGGRKVASTMTAASSLAIPGRVGSLAPRSGRIFPPSSGSNQSAGHCYRDRIRLM